MLRAVTSAHPSARALCFVRRCCCGGGWRPATPTPPAFLPAAAAAAAPTTHPSPPGRSRARARGVTTTVAMASPADAAPGADPLMQYVVLRRDLWGPGGAPGAPAGAPWPLGAVAAQAAHAATAALWESREATDTVAYCTGDALNHMTKVVLEVADGEALEALAARLAGAGVRHRVWVELPEGVPTAVASAPGRKSVLQPHFKAGKLCRVGIGGGGK